MIDGVKALVIWESLTGTTRKAAYLIAATGGD